MKRVLITAILFAFLAGTGIAADFASVSGNYISKKDDKEYLTLHTDGTFLLRQRKQPPSPENPFEELSGKYELSGDKISLILADGGVGTGTLSANTFEDGQGTKWVKEGTDQQHTVDHARPKKHGQFGNW